MTVRTEIIGNATLIYALLDSRNGELRYVGKTAKSLQWRVAHHLRQARRMGRKHRSVNWLRGLIKEGIRPQVIELERVESGEDWEEAERFWIEYMRFLGAKLLNMTLGGEGAVGHKQTQEHKDKIAAALRTRKQCKCLLCGKLFWRKNNQVRKHQDRYCSRRCSNNRHLSRDLFDA